MSPVRIAVASAMLAASTLAVAAQMNYPDKNIRLLYGFPPGNDIVTRIYADKLAEALGKPVIVENVTGAAGNIAADRTAKAAPDGYTIGVLTGANITINVTLYRKLPYDPVRDLIPVSLIFGYPNILLITNDVPAKSVEELVAVARAQPGKLTFGHNGAGTTTHLSGEIFKSMARIEIQDVPYRGPSAALSDLISGRIAMTFNTPTVTLPLAREGKARALAVTSRSRAPFAPDLPTMDESGFPGFETTVWFGLFAPAGTPAPIIDKLNRETAAVMALPDVRKKLLDIGIVPRTSTSAELAAMIATETPYWSRVLKDAGIKPIE
jgi:tripartite-type tricarboxylate transporter receptor subunit TctC